MSYSDIIRFKNLGKLANRRKGRNVLVNPFKNGIVKDGLALWLDGKDFTNSPPSTTWLDRSTNGNNVIPSGMAYTSVSGSDDMGGVVLDGINDYFGIPIMKGMNIGTGDFSILFSLKLSQIGIFHDVLGAGLIILYVDNTNRFIYHNGATRITSVAFNVNTQYYISVVRQLGIVKMKINGIDVGSPYSDSMSYNFSTINIGKAGSYTKGTVKSFLIYNRALTDTEILQNYNVLK